jgi:hypothetical protein
VDSSLLIASNIFESSNSGQLDLEALEASLAKSLNDMNEQIENQKKVLRKFKIATIEAENYTQKLSRRKDSMKEEIRKKQNQLSDVQNLFVQRNELNLEPRNYLINWFFNKILGKKDRIFLASKIGELEESILVLNEALMDIERSLLTYAVGQIAQTKVFRNTELLFDNLLMSRQKCQSIRTEVRKSLTSLQRSEDQRQLFEDYKTSIETLGVAQKKSETISFDREKANQVLELIKKENPLKSEVNLKIQKLLNDMGL